MTAALLPMVSNLTTSVVDIEHVLKNLFASNGTQSMTSASTSPNVKATNPEPYHDQSTTECQSRSSNTHGGLNCIAKGFTIGGLTTILLLLSLSMAMKIAQPINEVDLINVYPKDIIGQPMGLTTCAPPTTISSTTISSTTKRRPNTPKPTTPKARPARVIRQKYIPIRIIPARYKNGAKPRSFAMKSLDNSSPIRQTEESDEISQKYE
ncbi:hypothetical protein PV327_006607 [Microctonus hyperodae]|uniref:Uncharacterized protein n=1 Tax=Microctonus hyperodae TaxID=165561 RepID=A0AA39KIH1_MICHY|nr:hypothetical protein PV327_006607 [Microctonus hyperodae]